MIRYLGTIDRLYARLGGRVPLALFKIPFAILGIIQKVMESPGILCENV